MPPASRDPDPAPPPAPSADLRVLQANERTLLAWLRTGLGLMAFGFVVARVGVWLRAVQPGGAGSGWSAALGVAFVLLGTASHAFAAVHFVRTRRALLQGRAVVPSGVAGVALAAALVVLGALVAAYLAAL